METQNITLSIPKEILLRVKLLAVKRQTSVSGLLTQTLEGLFSKTMHTCTHDRSAKDKHTRARDLIRALWQSGEGCLSIQVLQEFYANVF